MVVKSGVTDDARVRREATALVDAGCQVTIVGDRPGPNHALPDVDIRFCREPSGRLSWAKATRYRRFIRWLFLPTHRRRDDRLFAKAAARLCSEIAADVVHAHDLVGLVAVTLATKRPPVLVYDAHECWTGRPRIGRPEWFGPWFDGRREQRLGQKATVVVTVSEELAIWLRTNRGFRDVRVIRNTADLGRGFPATPIAVHYGGRIDEERDLLTAAAGAALVDGIDLVIRGGGDQASIEALRGLGVDVLPPISPDALADELREAGIGLVTLRGGSINHEVALPNKLFLAVQAGVPVVAADLPAIRRVVTEYGLGELYVPGDALSFAMAIVRVVDRFDEFCGRVDASREALCWQNDSRVLASVYEEFAAP